MKKGSVLKLHLDIHSIELIRILCLPSFVYVDECEARHKVAKLGLVQTSPLCQDIARPKSPRDTAIESLPL